MISRQHPNFTAASLEGGRKIWQEGKFWTWLRENWRKNGVGVGWGGGGSARSKVFNLVSRNRPLLAHLLTRLTVKSCFGYKANNTRLIQNHICFNQNIGETLICNREKHILDFGKRNLCECPTKKKKDQKREKKSPPLGNEINSYFLPSSVGEEVHFCGENDCKLLCPGILFLLIVDRLERISDRNKMSRDFWNEMSRGSKVQKYFLNFSPSPWL